MFTISRLARQTAVALAVASFVYSPGRVCAQSTVSTLGAQEDSLAEVIVTATKRESTIQSTPMSISAVTGDDLLRRGISDVNDLVLQTPGVSIQSQGPGRTVFTIRGMSPSGGAAPTVGYYLDETPISPPPEALAPSGKSEIDPDLYDLARVEVLRGPQGTLYGAGSMGGTIRLITNEPQLGRFAASAQATGSGTQHGGANYGESGMLNLPLGEKFALRLVETYKYDDGFIDRIVVPNFPPPSADFLTRGDPQDATPSKVYKDVNDDQTKSVRAILLGKLNDSFSIKGSVFYQHLAQAGQNGLDLPPGNFAHYEAFDIPEQSRDEFSIYNLTADYHTEPVSVKSSSSVTIRHGSSSVDDTENYYTLFGLGFFAPGPTYTTRASRELSEELRATSNGSGPFQWIGGVFYDHFSDKLSYNEVFPEIEPIFGTPMVVDFQERDTIKQYAVFGEATYSILSSLTATAGLRYFHYDFRFTQDGVGVAIPQGEEHVLGESSHSGLNPKLTLAYTAAANTLLYATAAKGFRPGAPNGPVPGNIPGVLYCGDNLAAIGLTGAPASYDPDAVWNYELGGKFAMLEKRLQIDVAIYHLDWKDIQQNVTLACGYSFTANAGKAQVDGGELEVSARLGGGFTFMQSVGFTDGRITDQTIKSSSVERLQDVPRWTLNTSLDFDRLLVPDWNLTAHVNNQYTGPEYDPTPNPYPLSRRAGFAVMNARIALTHRKLTTALFIDNVADKRAYVGFEPGQSAAIPSVTRPIPIRPRTIGVDLQWTY